MIVLFGGKAVDKAFRVERLAGFLRGFERADHLLWTNPLFYAEVNAGVVLRIQKIIAFVLCIMHTEFTLNIFRQRMHL